RSKTHRREAVPAGLGRPAAGASWPPGRQAGPPSEAGARSGGRQAAAVAAPRPGRHPSEEGEPRPPRRPDAPTADPQATQAAQAEEGTSATPAAERQGRWSE